MTDSVTTAGSTPLELKFSQVFGERAPGEAVQDVDVITAIEFDKRGDYLAVGDRGGRVVVFERDQDCKDTTSHYRSRKKLEELDAATVCPPKFRYKTEFQSHEPEFDYLKSVEIEERIKKLKWCSTQNGSLSILSANDKTIKMYKIKDHKVRKVKESVHLPLVSSENVLLAERSYISEQERLSVANGFHSECVDMENDLSLSEDMHSKIAVVEDTSSTRCRKVYAHAHDFNINSISNNSDGETFISADDLRINLWNLEISDQCFNIIDMKPSNMEDLTEVITSAEFHPTHCNVLAYSSSRGFIYLTDMRQAALCDHDARILYGEPRGPKSFLTEIVASISDLKFLSDGRHLISRDYLNLKLWDMHMDSAPVAIFKIHEHLHLKLSELYNNDSIFDKFECCASGDGLHFATGSYSNILRLFSRGVQNDEGITIEASRTPYRKTTQLAAPRARRSSLSNLTRGFYRHGNDDNSSASNSFPCDVKAKLLHVTWHPTSTLVACAAENSLLLYHA